MRETTVATTVRADVDLGKLWERSPGRDGPSWAVAQDSIATRGRNNLHQDGNHDHTAQNETPHLFGERR